MFLTPCTGLWCVPHPMYWSMVCSSPHVLVYGVFLTPCTGLWCVPHPMYLSMKYGVFLTPCTGLWCVPHPMYWFMVCSSPHVLVYGVFFTPCTGLWCVPYLKPWSNTLPQKEETCPTCRRTVASAQNPKEPEIMMHVI